MRVEKRVDNVQNPCDFNEYFLWEIILCHYAISNTLNKRVYMPFLRSLISRP